MRLGVSEKGNVPETDGVKDNVTVSKRPMYDVVSSTVEFQGVAFGPRSGSARNVLPPAHASPEPIPPSTFADMPFSNVPESPDRSVVPESVPVASKVGVACAASEAKQRPEANVIAQRNFIHAPAIKFKEGRKVVTRDENEMNPTADISICICMGFV